MFKSIIFCLATAFKAAAKSPLTIITPSSLAEETVDMQASLGNFGHINYGTNMIGKIVYPSTINAAGCEPFTVNDFSDGDKLWMLDNQISEN